MKCTSASAILRIGSSPAATCSTASTWPPDQHYVAEPSQPAQQQAELLQDDIEALPLCHGVSSGGGRLLPAKDPDWKRYFKEYEESLRQAWLSGGLGGVPGA